MDIKRVFIEVDGKIPYLPKTVEKFVSVMEVGKDFCIFPWVKYGLKLNS